MAKITALISSCLAAASLVSAQHDPNVRIDKPALLSNLDYLAPGFEENLPKTAYTLQRWADGWIPKQCQYITGGNIFSDFVYNASDFEVYNVQYSDCGDPWVFCHHKDSTISIDSMASQFGRLTIQMRQWVRHVIDVPRDGGSAFEYDGTVVFMKPSDDMLSVIIHETGHSLDLMGAYHYHPLSTSDIWWGNLSADTHVPDNYAQTNLVENVAQATVLAVYNEHVPGGYGGLEPKWGSVFHQFATVITQAREAGVGNSIITPGQNQQCSHRLPSSDPVTIDATASRRRRGPKPDVSLKAAKEIIATRDSKLTNCELSW